MSELLSMEQAMAEIARLTDKTARLDKLCAELWCKNDKLTKECADLTNCKGGGMKIYSRWLMLPENVKTAVVSGLVALAWSLAVVLSISLII
jgi:hypothetical protein